MRFKKPFFTSQIDSRVFIQDYTIQYLRCIAYMRLKLRRSWHQQWGVVTWMIKKKVTILMGFFFYFCSVVFQRFLCLATFWTIHANFFFFLFSHNSFPEMSQKSRLCCATHYNSNEFSCRQTKQKEKKKTHHKLCALQSKNNFGLSEDTHFVIRMFIELLNARCTHLLKMSIARYFFFWRTLNQQLR